MTGILLKKQLTEIFRNYFYNEKKGVARDRKGTIAGITGYLVLLFAIFGLVFGMLANSICAPCVYAGQDWLYFSIFSTIAILLGLFGSVFSTYAEMYLAKDNDLLLSLPIPVSKILIARLTSVYLMGLLYAGTAMLPGFVVYAITAPFSIVTLFGCIWLLFLVSVVVLVLSCALGWLVALLSTKLKQKGVIVALLGVGGFLLYYYLYGKASMLINQVVANIADTGIDEMPRAAMIFYEIGSVATGNLVAVLIVTGIVAALFLLLWFVMKRSFISIVTTKASVKHEVYREKAVRQLNPTDAIAAKERRRFLSSPTYMLNCGLGILLLPAFGLYYAFRGQNMQEGIETALHIGPDGVAVVLGAIVCLIGSMIYISTPSVSLDGKTVWILHSLPLTPWDVLRGKFRNHFWFVMIPELICLVFLYIFTPISSFNTVLVTAMCVLHAAFMGYCGLCIGLKHANMNWSTETAPIKQNISILIIMLIGFASGAAIALGFILALFLVGDLNPTVYLCIVCVVEALLMYLMMNWLKTKGSQIFEEL